MLAEACVSPRTRALASHPRLSDRFSHGAGAVRGGFDILVLKTRHTAAEPVGVGGFEIGYVTDDGLEHRVSLSQGWATPFESCSPIRRFTSHKGQRHLSGLWWSAKDTAA